MFFAALINKKPPKSKGKGKNQSSSSRRPIRLSISETCLPIDISSKSTQLICWDEKLNNFTFERNTVILVQNYSCEVYKSSYQWKAKTIHILNLSNSFSSSSLVNPQQILALHSCFVYWINTTITSNNNAKNLILLPMQQGLFTSLYYNFYKEYFTTCSDALLRFVNFGGYLPVYDIIKASCLNPITTLFSNNNNNNNNNNTNVMNEANDENELNNDQPSEETTTSMLQHIITNVHNALPSDLDPSIKMKLTKYLTKSWDDTKVQQIILNDLKKMNLDNENKDDIDTNKTKYNVYERIAHSLLKFPWSPYLQELSESEHWSLDKCLNRIDNPDWAAFWFYKVYQAILKVEQQGHTCLNISSLTTKLAVDIQKVFPSSPIDLFSPKAAIKYSQILQQDIRPPLYFSFDDRFATDNTLANHQKGELWKFQLCLIESDDNQYIQRVLLKEAEEYIAEQFIAWGFDTRTHLAIPDDLDYGPLDQTQSKAMEQIFKYKLSALQAPPGTGKTKIIEYIVSNIQHQQQQQQQAQENEEQGVEWEVCILGEMHQCLCNLIERNVPSELCRTVTSFVMQRPDDNGAYTFLGMQKSKEKKQSKQKKSKKRKRHTTFDNADDDDSDQSETDEMKSTKLFIIIEEASTLKLFNLTRIFKILNNMEDTTKHEITIHMLFVGDDNQNDPISPGRPFRSFLEVFKPLNRVSELTTIYRQRSKDGQQNSALINNYMKVIQHNPSNWDLLDFQHFIWHKLDDRTESLITNKTNKRNILNNIILNSPYFNDYKFYQPTRDLIIALTHDTCHYINYIISERHRKQLNASYELNTRFFKGERIISDVTDLDLSIHVGLRGTILCIEHENKNKNQDDDDDDDNTGPLVARIRVSSTNKILSNIPINYLSPGYAITGLRGQGMESPHVLVVMDSFHCISNWIYTAMSRAQQLCIFISTPTDQKTGVMKERLFLCENITRYLYEQLQQQQQQDYLSITQKEIQSFEEEILKHQNLLL